MPLDAVGANNRTLAITGAFNDIGKVAPTTMPRSKRNDEPIAWEYFVAKLLQKTAEARAKKAQAAAVKAGVLFDHEKHPKAVGTDALVYSGEVVQIVLNVTNPTERLDVEAFCNGLRTAGVKPALIDKLVKQHTHPSRAPHKFTATLATD